jgi:hypothetical protein
LEKVQQTVDKIKNLDFFNLDDDDTTTTAENEQEDPLRARRNIFDGLSSKFKKIFGGKQSRSPEKSNELFKDFNVIESEPSFYESTDVESHQSDDEVVPVQMAQPSEDERLANDLSRFHSKLNAEQQLDISDFLDHMKEKPKQFKFDTGPFLLAELEKQKHPIVEQTKEEENDDGSRKFFEFDSGLKKRSLEGHHIDDYGKIAKMRSKLLAEYHHPFHPLLDYSDILRRVEAENQLKAVKKTDDFLDHAYRLNDGSSSIDETLKSFRPEKRVMSPFELHLNFQLDNLFKELDIGEMNLPVDSHADDDVPLLHKPETDESKQIDDFSP